MKESHFYAMMSRLKLIDRWALMRNSMPENLSEHSLEVAMLAHALAVIGNRYFGKELDAKQSALIGMYHDATEIITGDMPTPIKYFNRDIQEAFQAIEANAAYRLVMMLPEEMQEEFREIFEPGFQYEYEKKLVKAADKLSALMKCIEEAKAGNREFAQAEQATLEAITAMKLPEVEYFMKKFLPSYYKTLDELQ
ncbi:MAG: 5'-deoxynucleotidase [Lachnospiraceae bacterium]|jgi:5'-deoxynucleotidase|nr:5'-deoxynucleotidase [Lachnospiraceae bacterium]MCX4317886.1 5'-deoxynucleotidase [Lachnospiraceae bacterium]